MAIESEPAASSREVLVRSIRWEGDGILSFQLEPFEELLPSWEPGAHIDVVVGALGTRQYSLCGVPGEPDYRIAVLREPGGRGGSEHLHERIRPGDRLRVTGPRNHFRLESAERTVLIAGGIGITPLLPMVRQILAEGREWQLYYYGRERSQMAFLSELARLGERVRPIVSGEGMRLPLSELLAEHPEGTLFYACGPARMLDELGEILAERGLGDRLRSERFIAGQLEDVPSDSAGFTVELRSSGLSAEVGPDRSVLAAVASLGVEVMSDCEEGICGSCETRVLEGVPEHRDFILTPQERAANDCMMICVSRAASGCSRLVLDL